MIPKYMIIGLILVAVIVIGIDIYIATRQTSTQETITPTTTTETTTSAQAESTTTEIEAIRYMAEEEKLAYDVYTKLAEMYPDVPVFANIAKSESTHVNAVLSLAEKYGIDIKLGPAGKFNNTHIQELYNHLVEMGSKSLEDALKVGATIEEVDIVDLRDWISKVNKPDIIQVFECLMMGSRNHLRAFTSTLQNIYGTTYTPQYLSQEEYEQIINSPMETGNTVCLSIGINVSPDMGATQSSAAKK